MINELPKGCLIMENMKKYAGGGFSMIVAEREAIINLSKKQPAKESICFRCNYKEACDAQI